MTDTAKCLDLNDTSPDGTGPFDPLATRRNRIDRAGEHVGEGQKPAIEGGGSQVPEGEQVGEGVDKQTA